MVGVPTDRKLYKSLLKFPQHWSRGNSNQKQYYVLIQKSYTEAKSCYINSIYELLHQQFYVTEQYRRALLTSHTCERTRMHRELCKQLLSKGAILLPSLREEGTSHALWTWPAAGSASAPVPSCPFRPAGTVVTCTLSHSTSARCLALTNKA